MSPERLVYMANQIATFFKTQDDGEAVADTADHIRKFWDPRMRQAIRSHVESGGAGLDPVALAAVRLLIEADLAKTG